MAMIKYNVCGGINPVDGKRASKVFTRPYHYFVEPWFVPRPGGTAEDDGVVLVLALDGAVGKGVLYVLDAATLEVNATIRLPVLVNFKTHGRFVWGGAT
jgi:carotenoid cleavage dioxygenase-like enzyme